MCVYVCIGVGVGVCTREWCLNRASDTDTLELESQVVVNRLHYKFKATLTRRQV